MRPDNSIEKVLVSKLKKGNKNAFSVIFITYYKDLVLFAATFTHEYDSAEEIVQDTFTHIWEEHDSVNIDISIKSYLLKAVRNKCIDWLRHKKVMQNYIQDALTDSVYYECNTDNYLINSEIEGLIKIALEKLSPEISMVYRMHRFEGLRYQEIAEKLNVSVRTIETRIGKALCSLRDVLHDYLTK